MRPGSEPYAIPVSMLTQLIASLAADGIGPNSDVGHYLQAALNALERLQRDAVKRNADSRPYGGSG